MSVIGGVGLSKETKIKQAHLKQILMAHMRIVNGRVLKTWKEAFQKYVFIDMNAGRGFYEDSDFQFGSPLIALQCAKELGFEIYPIFIEQNKDNALALAASIKAFFPEYPCHIIIKDHKHCTEDVFRLLPRLKTFGFCYNDPTGMPSFETLSTISDNANKLDLLIYMQATSIKRVASVHDSYCRMKSGLGTINKTEWLVRKPRDKYQFTFAIGTNWAGFPEFKSMGFHNTRTDTGALILDRLDLTDKEFRRKHCGQQLGLYDIPGISSSPGIQEGQGESNAPCQLCLPRMQGGKGHGSSSLDLPEVGKVR